ncbi:unnamed protein product [Penicillium olsonii]|nr:unnamed protein product [Penicillium olsonii]CAG7932819.1 unnamed protein product [Penicillium olsonii]
MAMLWQLPTELILLIMEFLAPFDCRCFSTCNRQLYAVFSRYINVLPSLSADDKYLVALQLEKDLHRYFACNICKLLHRYDGSESLGLGGFFPRKTCPLPCVQAKMWIGHWFSIKNTVNLHPYQPLPIPQFSFLHVKLALRRFRYGPECGISTDSLSHTQVTECSGGPCNHNMSWLFSRDAQIRIEPPSLLLRVQDILCVSKWRHLLDNQYQLCSDPCKADPDQDDLRPFLTPILESLANKKQRVDNTWTVLGSCHETCSFHQVDFYEVDSHKALVMTRWYRLGDGLNQDDPIWRSHTSEGEEFAVRCEADPNFLIDDEYYMQRFEETAALSFNELVDRNLSYLKNKEYKRVMRYERDWKTWHSPFREPSSSRIINLGRDLQYLLGLSPDLEFGTHSQNILWPNTFKCIQFFRDLVFPCGVAF